MIAKLGSRDAHAPRRRPAKSERQRRRRYRRRRCPRGQLRPCRSVNHKKLRQLYNKPKWPSYGVDGSYWFNNTCWIGTANYCLFFAFGIFPHVVQRVFASKTDETCKRSMILMAICMCLAGMPGLILGFFYAIHLKKDYSAATAAFGAILDYMMRQGLFSE